MGKIGFNKVYRPSEDVVTREVGGEFVVIPITSGIGDIDDEIFTLNETGKAIWDKLDGRRDLSDIAKALASDFRSSSGEIEKDVAGFVGELLKRKMLVEIK